MIDSQSSSEQVLTVEQRHDILEKILLGRTITKIQPSRDYNGNYTGWYFIVLNDGSTVKIRDDENGLLIDPFLDINKLNGSPTGKIGGEQTWPSFEPYLSDESIKLYKEMKTKGGGVKQ